MSSSKPLHHIIFSNDPVMNEKFKPETDCDKTWFIFLTNFEFYLILFSIYAFKSKYPLLNIINNV